MTGAKSIFDGDYEPPPEEMLEFYEDLLRRLASNTLHRYALFAYAKIIHMPSIGLCGDVYHWPYAGRLEEASLCDEMMFLLKQTGSEHFEPALVSQIRPLAETLSKTFSDAEEDLLWQAALLDTNSEMTTTALRDWVDAALTQEIIDIARDYGTDTIIEALEAHRIAFVPLPEEDEDVSG